MACSDFTFAKVREVFGLSTKENRSLFAEVVGVQPSELLRQTLEENLPLAIAINSEKARSEFIIVPVSE